MPTFFGLDIEGWMHMSAATFMDMTNSVLMLKKKIKPTNIDNKAIMIDDIKGLVWRFRIVCVSWSLTCLFLGIAFVYGMLYECADTKFDSILSTYSVGIGLTGVLVSLGLSINTYLHRRKVDG